MSDEDSERCLVQIAKIASVLANDMPVITQEKHFDYIKRLLVLRIFAINYCRNSLI